MDRLGESESRELAVLHYVDRNGVGWEQLGLDAELLNSILTDLQSLGYVDFYDGIPHITYLGEEVIRPAQRKGGTNG